MSNIHHAIYLHHLHIRTHLSQTDKKIPLF